MSKINRQTVLNKYDNHCAYCGKEINLKTMQVDHIKPKVTGGSDEIENLNPACRRCNHYKRAETIEQFRLLVKSLHERLTKIYIVKVAIDFGIIKIKPFDGKFYFEQEATNE